MRGLDALCCATRSLDPPCCATRGHDALCCAMRGFFTDFSCAMRGTVATHGFILRQWS